MSLLSDWNRVSQFRTGAVSFLASARHILLLGLPDETGSAAELASG